MSLWVNPLSTRCTALVLTKHLALSHALLASWLCLVLYYMHSTHSSALPNTYNTPGPLDVYKTVLYHL